MTDEARLAAVLEVRLNRIDEKLSEYNRKVSNSMRKASKDIEGVNDNWAKAFNKKPNLAKALDGVFDNTRLKVLDSGVARVGLFGSALEELGPVGLGAAAAIGAVALSLAQTRAAATFADEISDVANRLHVTTDALQEYRYAIRLAGGEEKGADEALESFGVTLGKAQANLPKAVKGFTMLGFTKAQIDSFKTVEEGLVAVTGRIEKLKSDPQKDAIISQLGLDGMKPLIDEGVEAMTRLRAEAQSVGIVMDAGLVARGAEANDKFETLEKIISVQLKSAFVDLSPVLLGLLGIAADLSHEFADIAANFQAINERSTQALKDKRDQLVSSIAADNQVGFLPGAKELIAHKQGKLANINAELVRREAAAKAVAPGVPDGTSLIDPAAAAAAAAARQKALQRSAASEQAIDAATKGEIAARQELTHGIFELAGLKAAEIDAETKRANDRLRADAAQNKITQSAADAAIRLNNRAADERKAGLAAEAMVRWEDDRLSKSRELAGILDQTTGIYADLARTVAQRRALEAKVLEQQHKDRLAELNVRKDRALREDRPDDLDHVKRLIAAENENYGAASKQLTKRNQGPVADWLDRAPQSIAELNEAFQALDMQGLESLNQGLAQAIVNSQSLGDVAANVFKQLEVQVLQMLLTAGEAKLASVFGLPGFATGGHVRGPGSGTSDSIPAYLSDGEFVVNAAATRQHRKLLEQINSGRIGKFSTGGLVANAGRVPSLSASATPVVQQFFPNFSGAVMTEDLLHQFKAYADRTAGQAAMRGAQGGAALARQQAQRSATNWLGVR